MTREEIKDFCDMKVQLEPENEDIFKAIVKTLEQEPTTKNETLVSLDVYKQVAKERDIAIQQLHELGYDFGQKIEPTTKNDLGVDCISREQAINAVNMCSNSETILNLQQLPSVTPQEPTDKNFTKADIDAIVKAINAHWELIIDEIRAEIEQYWKYCDDNIQTPTLRSVKQILDKYKAESEEE